MKNFYAQITKAYRKAFEKSKALELAKFPIKGFYANQGNQEKLLLPNQLAFEKEGFNPSSVKYEATTTKAYSIAFGYY